MSVRLDPPLEASSNTFRFHLNRPAYVALFEVIPGRGAAPMYPMRGSEATRFEHGIQTIRLFNTLHRANYLSPTSTIGPQPRYLLLVASERPLNLESIMQSPHALRRMMGLPQFSSWNAHSTMDLITEYIVPDLEAGDWSSDVFVDWPQSLPRARVAIVRVNCPNGDTRQVPLDMVTTSRLANASFACDARQTFSYTATRAPISDSGPADPGTPHPPRRKRPEIRHSGTPHAGGREDNIPSNPSGEPRSARPQVNGSHPRSSEGRPRRPHSTAESAPRSTRSEGRAESRSKTTRPSEGTRVENPAPSREQ